MANEKIEDFDLTSIIKEGIEPTREALQAVGDKIPELNFWCSSFYTIIFPVIFKQIAAALPQPSVLGPVGNYIDSGASILLGISQLADRHHHRQAATKLKGIINIGSGVQLAVLTKVSITALGPIGVTAALGAAFVMSLDETQRSVRRHVNKEYYIEDNLKQLNSVQEQIRLLDLKIKATADVKIVESEHPVKFKLKAWSEAKMATELKELEAKKVKMEQDTLVQYLRLRLTEYEDLAKTNSRYENYQELYGKEFLDKIKEIDSVLRKKNKAEDIFPEIDNIIGRITYKDRKDNPIQISIFSRDNFVKYGQHIDQENRLSIKGNLKNNVCLGLGFLGMLFLCFPPTHLAGIVLVGIASALYFASHSEQIKEKVTDLIDSVVTLVKSKMATSFFPDVEKNQDDNNESKPFQLSY